MHVLSRDTMLWNYLSPEVKDLIEDGEVLVGFAERYRHQYKQENYEEISDFSFMVFSFAKAYEGFCKKFFLDLDIITLDDYYGDEIRIGRLLSPRHRNSTGHTLGEVCRKLCGDESLAKNMWIMWKKGRNLVFHYFPHNYRKLTYEEAYEIIEDFIKTMRLCAESCSL